MVKHGRTNLVSSVLWIESINYASTIYGNAKRAKMVWHFALTTVSGVSDCLSSDSRQLSGLTNACSFLS